MSTPTLTNHVPSQATTGRAWPWDSIRAALTADVVASGALGALLVPGALVSERLLGIPALLALGLGGFLIMWAALVASVAWRPTTMRVREVSALNLLWVVASLAFWLTDPVGLTTLGAVVVVAQAVAVLDLVILVSVAAKRSGS